MMWWGGDGFGHMPTWGWVGIIFMVLFWIAVIVGVALLVRCLVRRPERTMQAFSSPGVAQDTGGAGALPAKSGALQILEERYARGEIDQEEFLRRKGDLQA